MSDNQQSPKTNKNEATSKMIVITPDQLAKLGLTAHIQNAIRPQNSPTVKTDSNKAEHVGVTKKLNVEPNKANKAKTEVKPAVYLTKQSSNERDKTETVSHNNCGPSTSVQIEKVLPQQGNETEIKETSISSLQKMYTPVVHSKKQTDESVFIAPQPKTLLCQSFPKISASSYGITIAAASAKAEKTAAKEKQFPIASCSQEQKVSKSRLLNYYATQGKIKKKLTGEHKHSKKLKAVSSDTIYPTKKKFKLSSLGIKTSGRSVLQNVNLVKAPTSTAKASHTEKSEAFVFKIPAPVKSRAVVTNKNFPLSSERKIETYENKNANNKDIIFSKEKQKSEVEIDKIVDSVIHKTDTKNSRTEKVGIDEITVEKCESDATQATAKAKETKVLEFRQNKLAKNSNGAQNVSGSTKLIVKEKKYGSNSLEIACSGIIERVCTNEDYFPEVNSASTAASENISPRATIAPNTLEEIERKDSSIKIKNNTKQLVQASTPKVNFAQKGSQETSSVKADSITSLGSIEIIQKSSKRTGKPKLEAKTKNDIQEIGGVLLTERKTSEANASKNNERFIITAKDPVNKESSMQKIPKKRENKKKEIKIENLQQSDEILPEKYVQESDGVLLIEGKQTEKLKISDAKISEANVSKDNVAIARAVADSSGEQNVQKIPKKRGRKKKEIKIEENLQRGDEHLSENYVHKSDGVLLIEGKQSAYNEAITKVGADLLNVESMEKIPKKRGRKRKIKTEEDDDYISEDEEKSYTRKRKHKKVNYSALNSGDEYGDTFGAEKYQNFQKRKGKQAGTMTVNMFNSLFENFNTSVLNPNTSIIENEMKTEQDESALSDVKVEINSASSSNGTSGEFQNSSISVNDVAPESDIESSLLVAVPSPSNRYVYYDVYNKYKN